MHQNVAGKNNKHQRFYFPKYKSFFQSGFFLLFKQGTLLPEIQERYKKVLIPEI